MCHLVLLMPIFGLILFWLLPMSEALPIYLVILVVSGALYFVLMRALHRPVATGDEGLLGKSVSVVDMHGHDGQVRINGTTWHAVSDDDLENGDRARVVSVDGLTLTVKRIPQTR